MGAQTHEDTFNTNRPQEERITVWKATRIPVNALGPTDSTSGLYLDAETGSLGRGCPATTKAQMRHSTRPKFGDPSPILSVNNWVHWLPDVTTGSGNWIRMSRSATLSLFMTSAGTLRSNGGRVASRGAQESGAPRQPIPRAFQRGERTRSPSPTGTSSCAASPPNSRAHLLFAAAGAPDWSARPATFVVGTSGPVCLPSRAPPPGPGPRTNFSPSRTNPKPRRLRIADMTIRTARPVRLSAGVPPEPLRGRPH